MIFGPDARTCSSTTARQLRARAAAVDKVRVYAAGAAVAIAGRAVRVLPLHAAPARRSAPAPTTSSARGGRARREAALRAHLRPRLRLRRRGRRADDPARPTSRRCSAPAYTLLAFVIVIVGGLGSMAGALVGGVLIGVSEALAGLFIAPSLKSMFVRAADPGAAAASARPVRHATVTAHDCRRRCRASRPSRSACCWRRCSPRRCRRPLRAVGADPGLLLRLSSARRGT